MIGNLPSKFDRGEQIGEGGEGRVYRVVGREDLVLKVYHQPLKTAKVSKLLSMIDRTPHGVEQFAAWPLKVLRNKSDEPMAVVLPRIIGARDIHQLYSPRGRRVHFPRADWNFLLLAAQNLSKAFANVHELGCVIGDVNHASVLVKENAQVALIDCDSFQVRVGSQLFECEVAVPTFTPPELQGRSLAGVERTSDHDAFGLAVLVFHLLFMGRHPFAGRPVGRAELSIEQAIKERRFAFSSERARVLLDPPPNTLPLKESSPQLGMLFERAFGNSLTRPTPAEWNAVLAEVRSNTVRCRSESSHVYFGALPACPWCRIESSTGAILFHSTKRPFAPTAFARDELDIGIIETLWRAVVSVRRPEVAAFPTRDSLAPTPGPTPSAQKVGDFSRIVSRFGFGASALGGVVATVAFPDIPVLWCIAGIAPYWLVRGLFANVNGSKKVTLSSGYNASKARWESISARWRTETDLGPFDALSANLRSLRGEHDRIAGPLRSEQQRRKLSHEQALRSWSDRIVSRAAQIRKGRVVAGGPTLTDAEVVAAFDAQHVAHLDSFDIEKADIPDIGPSRKATLASFGVETAADVSQSSVTAVPGFGPRLAKRLLDWRKMVSARFVFDPNRARIDLDAGRVQPEQAPSPPAPVHVEDRAKSRLRQIESDIARGGARLQEIATRLQATRSALLNEAREAAHEFARAEADARAARLIR